MFYAQVYNTFLTSPAYRLIKSINTILVTNILEKEILTLKEICGTFPNRVRSI